MEESILISKIICYYFLSISFIDSLVISNQLLWPISYFLISSMLTSPTFAQASLASSCLLSSYTFGKFAFSTPISILSYKYSLKPIFLCLLFLSSISSLLLGIFPHFYGIFISRLLSGITSNIQPAVRQVLLSICSREKTSWSEFCIKINWTCKVAGLCGIVISGFLSNPGLILSSVKETAPERWFLLGLIMFLMNISGLLLVFSIDTSSLTDFILKKNELADESPIKPELDNTTDVKTDDRAQFNFKRFIDEKEIEKEDVINLEEVKYYSPRHDANKSSCFKAPMSARPELRPRDSSETVEEKIENDVKKTHISIIEDDLENTQQTQQAEVEQEKALRPCVRFAKGFRCLSCFYFALFFENLPLLFIFLDRDLSIGKVTVLAAVPYLVSAVLKNLAVGRLLDKVPLDVVARWCLTVNSVLFLLISVLLPFQVPAYVLSVLSTLILLSFELFNPLGVVLISDSVPSSCRESVLTLSTSQSLLFKLVSPPIGALLLLSPLPSLYPALLLGTSLYLLKQTVSIRARYSHLCRSPYYL